MGPLCDTRISFWWKGTIAFSDYFKQIYYMPYHSQLIKLINYIFLINRLYSLEQLYVHSKIEQKVKRVSINLNLPPQFPLLLLTSCISGIICYNWWDDTCTLLRFVIYIKSIIHITVLYSSMSFDNCIITVSYKTTILSWKILCAPTIHFTFPKQTITNYWSFFCTSNFAFSIMSCFWNHKVYNLFRVTSLS